MGISIITINYNNAVGLRKTFESVFSQGFEDYEYIVIDGGSSDGSAEIIQKSSQHISYWISEKDNGIYDAMNKGIAKATGDYLIFLNSGDCLNDVNTLQNCFKFINEHSGADIFYGNIFISTSSAEENILKTFPNKLSIEYFQSTTINHQASLISADLFKEFGLYPERYKLASDYWLFLKSLLNNKKYSHLNFPMVIYDNEGVSAQNMKLYQNEKSEVWESLVPECILDIIEENKQLKKQCNYKIIKAAAKLNSNWQWLKK